MFYRNKNIFKSKNKTVLNIRQLTSYLFEDKSSSDWYGVSFQKDVGKYILTNDIYMYFNEAFSDILDYVGLHEDWIIQPCHTKKLFIWFEPTDNMPEINTLKSLLPDPYHFKGYIIMNTINMKLLFRDLFLYSYLTGSQDLFLICRQKQIAIQLGQHLTIDVISNEYKIIDDIIFLLDKYRFVVKHYI